MSMEYRPLGRSGLVVSTVGIGCNAFGSRVDAEGVRDIVDTALDVGVNFFDTSDTYGFGASEELLGDALRGRREEVVVATKFGMDMEGRNGPDRGARAIWPLRRAADLRAWDPRLEIVEVYDYVTQLSPLPRLVNAVYKTVNGGPMLGNVHARHEPPVGAPAS